MPSGQSRLNSSSALPARRDPSSTNSSSSTATATTTLSTPSTTSHSSYLSALRQIDSIPVHDLAATLTNPSAPGPRQDAGSHAPSSRVDPQNEWRAQNAASERLRVLQEQLRSLGEVTGRLDAEETALHEADMSSTGSLDSGSGQSQEDARRRERLNRVLSRLNQVHNSLSTAGGTAVAPSYGEGLPSHNSLYDWSPPSLAELSDLNSNSEAELEAIRRELRRQLPHHHPEVLRVMAENVRTEMHGQNRARHSSQSQSQRSSSGSYERDVPAAPRSEQSLRSQAILQAVRRHPRFSARSREYMQRYIADRSERNSGGSGSAGSEVRERYSSSGDRYPRNRSTNFDSRMEDLNDRISRLRRSMLPDPTATTATTTTPPPPPPAEPQTPSDQLDRAIAYLSNLRQSQSFDDSFKYAIQADLVDNEFFRDRQEDFVVNLNALAPICPTSVLARGSKFKGFQRANPDANPSSQSSIRPSTRRWDRQRRLALDDMDRPFTGVNNSIPPPHAQRAAHGTKSQHPDQWPVEVTIHDVDWDRMTISATMEAQDVPSHTSTTSYTNNNNTFQLPRIASFDSLPDLVNPDGTIFHSDPTPSTLEAKPPDDDDDTTDSPKPPLKTITTYLEGEILDFRTHTFLTESFPSTPANDATYWLKLEPFRSLATPATAAAHILTPSFLDALSERYVLMRWKERCFVDEAAVSAGAGVETAAGCGLTISGFYYVCLRRADGRVEGLYCDPNSSPYQHLVLERSVAESWWVGWEFK